MRIARSFAAAAAGSMLAAAGQPASAPTQPRPYNAPDPNQVICEKHQVTGSRLAVRRVCKTRAQWADQRLQDRQDVEKVQTQRGIAGDD